MQKISIKSLSVLIFLGILVTGCVVIPLPGGEAFSDDEVEFIEVGSTTRSQIRTRLGRPLVRTFVDGPIELYRDFNATAVIVSLTADASSKVGITVYLVIEYDEHGIVQRAERIKTEDQMGCTIDGLCFVERGGLTFVANADEDMAAKDFRPVEGQCTVYLYSNRFRIWGIARNFDPSPVWLNEQPNGVIGWDETRYYLWHLAPGRHRIAASHRTGIAKSINLTNPIDLNCHPGELLFLNLEQVNVGNVFAGYHLETSLTEIDSATGREDIRKRAMALDGFSHRLQPNFVDATASNPVFKRALAGDAEAQYLLGTMYLKGPLVLPNGAEALKWLGLAAEQHHADAMHLLGEIYRWGRRMGYRIAGKGVVKRDKVEALKWFILASEQGHEKAAAKVEKRKSRNYWDRSAALALEWNAAH